MKTWLRRSLIAVGLISALAAGAIVLLLTALGHDFFEVHGDLLVEPPGPSGLRFPAVACLWANSYKIPTPSTIRTGNGLERNAYVVCRIPKGGVRIPFHVSHYSTTAHGFLVGAFLRGIPDGHPACTGDHTILAVVPDPDSTLERVCSTGSVPPQTDVALMAPFDDDKGRPATTMRLVIARAGEAEVRPN